MAIREILKMGDPRLLRQAQPVTQFGTPELAQLVDDMFETMRAVNGAGLAAPQIGVDLQLVIFGFGHNQRYPEAPAVPETVLINALHKLLNFGEVREELLPLLGCAAREGEAAVASGEVGPALAAGGEAEGRVPAGTLSG